MTTSRWFGSRNGFTHARACSRLATMLRCSSIAPLATPVVPPVYWRNAMSSWPSGTVSSLRRRPSASTSDSRSAPATSYAGIIFFTRRSTRSTISPLNPSSSPMVVTIGMRIFVLPITSCSVCAKFSTMTITSAPESFSWCSSSRAVYSGLTLTIVQPARIAPKRHTGYWRMLGIISATRLPFRQPFACSHAPNAARQDVQLAEGDRLAHAGERRAARVLLARSPRRRRGPSRSR